MARLDCRQILRLQESVFTMEIDVVAVGPVVTHVDDMKPTEASVGIGRPKHNKVTQIRLTNHRSKSELEALASMSVFLPLSFFFGFLRYVCSLVLFH